MPSLDKPFYLPQVIIFIPGVSDPGVVWGGDYPGGKWMHVADVTVFRCLFSSAAERVLKDVAAKEIPGGLSKKGQLFQVTPGWLTSPESMNKMLNG